MKNKFYMLFIILVTLCACACQGQTQISDSQAEVETAEIYEPSPTKADWKYPVLSVEHGEDYVIQWEDEGMEAHVRLCLDKPEGDIYHSEVWDIRLLRIGESSGYDVMIEKPEDRDYFWAHGDSIDSKRRIYHDETMPNIVSLRDLRHFDSLQILGISCDLSNSITDISGPEECVNLQVCRLYDTRPATLDPIGEMKSLERFSLTDATLENELDLTPLEKLEKLVWVQIVNTDILSLDPLAELDLEALNMLCDVDHFEIYEDLDYMAIHEMDTLRYINLGNNYGLKYEDMETILNKLKQLERVDISYIFTQEEVAELRENYPNIQFDCGGYE